MGNLRVEDTHFPKNSYLKVKDKLIDLSSPKIMGIVNLTPDSFFLPSRKTNDTALISTVNQMIEDGMDLLDLGGFSTRPNSENVTIDEELSRVIDPITVIKKEFPQLLITLDTFRGEVAQAGIDVGVDIINDISGFQYDPKLIEVVAKNKVPYILMHINADPSQMHVSHDERNIFQEMIYYFSEKIQVLSDYGIHDVLIDPGFGFSKTLEQNYEILNKLELFHVLEKPLLVGLSRKSMIYKKLQILPEEALNGTTILNTKAILKGTSILRVHDVKEAKQIIQLFF